MKSFIKTLQFLIVLLLAVNHSFAQNDIFRLDFDYACIYDKNTNVLGEWFKSHNTFIFNINTNFDIKHYRADGKVIVFRNLKNKKEGVFDDGIAYESLLLVDEWGTELRIYLLDNGVLLLEFPDNIIKFSPQNN